jgi:hypothetical protein
VIGRRVKTFWGETGVVVQWEPLLHSMTDALVRHDDGRLCWHASHSFQPIDDGGPLPSRAQALDEGRQAALDNLKIVRAQHVAEVLSHKPWPGMEFGKAHVGQMIDGAIASLEDDE